MFVVISFLCKSFTTLTTHVWLFSSVDSHVIDEVPCFVESAIAVVVLANVVSQNSSSLFVMLICGFKVIIPHWCNVSLFDIVIFWRSRDPFSVRLFIMNINSSMSIPLTKCKLVRSNLSLFNQFEISHFKNVQMTSITSNLIIS